MKRNGELVDNGYNILSEINENDILNNAFKIFDRKETFDKELYGDGKSGDFILQQLKNSKMRFVHVEDFVHPNAGYQINLLTRLQASQGHEVIIVAGALDKIPTFLTSFLEKII